MVKKAPVSKSQQMAKASKTSVKEKKKWSKGKTKEAVRRLVAIDDRLLEKIIKELPTNIITKSHLSEKYNLNGGLSQKILNYLEENNAIVAVNKSSLIKIYTRKKLEAEEEILEVAEDEQRVDGQEDAVAAAY